MDDSILRQIEQQSKIHRWPIIGVEKGKVLVEVVKKYQRRNVLEIGTLVGYSAILMAAHLSKDGLITTVEISQKMADIAKRHIAQAGFTGCIKMVTGSALDAIPILEGPFDLLFLDAAKDEYFDYLKAAESKLSSGAVVVADNAGRSAHAMREYLYYVRTSGLYRSETRDFGFDAVEVSERVAPSV